MKIVDGKALSATLRAELKERLEKSNITPGLAVVIVGQDPASQIYVRNKVRACEEIGIRSFTYALEETVTQKELESLLDALAQNEDIHGILLQLPLPTGFDAESAMAHIPV